MASPVLAGAAAGAVVLVGVGAAVDVGAGSVGAVVVDVASALRAPEVLVEDVVVDVLLLWGYGKVHGGSCPTEIVWSSETTWPSQSV